MGRVTGTVTVDRPIAEVFAFLADGENDKKFSDRIIEIRNTTPGEIGVGTVFESTAKDMGLKAKHQTKLTEFEPPTKIRWEELSKGPIYIREGGYDLAEEGEGTRVTYFNDLQGRGIGKLLEGTVTKRLAKGADEFAQKIKQAVETQVSATR
jgi:carbon monoxide dehydrogenase subunit G